MRRPYSLALSPARQTQPRTPSRQMSLAPPPLRRAMRPVPARAAPRVLSRDRVAIALAREWPGLMLRKFPSDAACGAGFGRTRQTGTNWRSGHCKPDAASLAMAALVWPEDFAAMFEGVA